MINFFKGVNKKEKKYLSITFFFILFNAFPIFSDLTHIPNQIACIFVTVGIVSLYPSVLRSRPIKWLFIYIGILLFLSLFKYVHISGLSETLPAWYRLLIEMAWIMPSLLISSVLLSQQNERLFKLVAYGSVILMTISFVYILPMIMAYANILREDVMNEDIIRPVGLPDYTLMHAYAFMLLPLYLWTKRTQGIKKYVLFAIALLFSYIVIRTSVTTSLFAMMAALSFVILFNPQNRQRSYVSFALLGLFIFVIYETGILLWIVDSLMPFFDGTAVSYKLQDFHDSLVSGSVTGDSLTSRAEHHARSREGFYSNPLFGANAAGGHSKVLDILGTAGLLGFVPFAMIILSCIKSYKMQMTKDMVPYLYFSFGLCFMYLYQKGIFGATGWLFMCVIAPSLIKAISSDSNKS